MTICLRLTVNASPTRFMISYRFSKHLSPPVHGFIQKSTNRGYMEPTPEMLEDDLLAMIGESLPSQVFGTSPRKKDKQQLIKLATEWIQGNRLLLCDAICKNEAIRSLFKSPERELAFHLVCDALAKLALDVHVGALAAYLVRRGVHSLCDEH